MGVVVGISVGVDDRGRWREGRVYHYADASYARAVVEAGGTPVYLPCAGDPRRSIERVDALLIPGGDDFAPQAPYPADVHLEIAPADQVAFDRGLLEGAHERGLPVLAICYGAQLLVLREGGALYHHLPTDLPHADAHQLDEQGRHGLVIEPGTRLAAILGDTREPVNSQHHQGIADAGPSLRVCARAPDDLIEAVEAVDRSFRIGVQWHPEKLTGSHRDGLFGAFVRAARDDAGAPSHPGEEV
jgi:putative glutamine amidotransferase